MEYERRRYQDKFQLMNKSEKLLFDRLREAAPALLVFSQVSMSQLFHITNYKKNGFLQVGEIGRKSVDFLLCRPDDTSIVLAIELNGPTHEQEEQKIGDAKKQTALEEAGIPLVIFTPNNIPSVDELRKILAPRIIERRKYEATKKEKIQQANSKKKTNQLTPKPV